ncbi:MAG: glycosyltransferase [Nanoarchaeota archaeon]|nr:glycosyltransferase [Nanoarchaeota archaeon]
MDENPLISVVIPTYNEENYIKDLLESIKQQTYKNYEIIVSDYHSTDETVKIAEKYGAKVIEVDRAGVSAAKNEGAKNASGEIIAFIDADYILSQNVFDQVVKTFLRNENVVVVEPKSRVNIKDLNLEKRTFFKFYSRWQNFYKSLSFLTPIPSAYGCVFCRKDAIDKAGLFNENITMNEDREFSARLRKVGEFRMINATARKSYRRHAKQGVARTEILYFLSFLPAFLLKEVKIPLKPFRGDNKKKKE